MAKMEIDCNLKILGQFFVIKRLLISKLWVSANEFLFLISRVYLFFLAMLKTVF